jgi:plasmid stabilization system protein ParE
MIPIVFSKAAKSDLQRVYDFIAVHDPKAAQRAAAAIKKTIQYIQQWPLSGRVVRERLDIRDSFIAFGKSGYCLRYRITQRRLEILRIWHQRETRL